jgi:hypothetical protein
MKCSHPLPEFYYLDKRGRPWRVIEWCGRCGATRRYKNLDNVVSRHASERWRRPLTGLASFLIFFNIRKIEDYQERGEQ